VVHRLPGRVHAGKQKYCYPLTVSDHASRYLLLCEAMESIQEQGAFTAFERLVKERGLPQAIRSDNGVPFASPNGLFHLSRLAVWWLRLGITIERIQPGHPQQNGRHERMHRTLKIEATRPAGSNFLQQQAKFDAFVREFNCERPHEALEMKYPADFYKPSTGLTAASENFPIPSTIALLLSPVAEESASTKRKSISALFWRVKLWASKRSTTVSGLSALWTMISVISIWRKKLCSPYTTLLVQGCKGCLRNVL
jgi:integrase-like protein